MYGGEPDVAGGHAILPFFLQVGEKGQDCGRIHVGQIQLWDGLPALAGKKAEQQDDAVAVAVDGVRARSPKPGQVIREVVPDDRAEKIGRWLVPRRCSFRDGSGVISEP